MSKIHITEKFKADPYSGWNIKSTNIDSLFCIGQPSMQVSIKFHSNVQQGPDKKYTDCQSSFNIMFKISFKSMK